MAEEYEQLYVPTFDGTFLYAELRLPPGDGPHPAVVYIHGGRGGSPPGPRYSRQVRSFLLADGYAHVDLDYRRYHVREMAPWRPDDPRGVRAERSPS